MKNSRKFKISMRAVTINCEFSLPGLKRKISKIPPYAGMDCLGEAAALDILKLIDVIVDL